MTENNSKLFLHKQVLVLKFFGLWTPKKRNIIYNIYGIFTLSIQYIALVFTLTDLAIVWGDTAAMSRNFFLLLPVASNCFKITTVLFNTDGFRKILYSMKIDIFAPKSATQEKILLQQSRKVRNMYNILIVMGIINCLLWGVMPFFSQGPKSFPLYMWMPVTAETSLGFAVGYTYQMIFSLTTTPIFMTIILFGITTIIFGCAQLDVVIDKIRKIRTGPPRSLHMNRTKLDEWLLKSNKLLNECIGHHQAIVRYIESIEELLNATLFFHLSGAVLMICTAGLRITTDPPNTIKFYTTLLFLCFVLCQLYLYCWSGNELTTRSEELRKELYQCPWYEQDHSFKRTLLIAMECMKRPIVFTVGYYITLTRPTFVWIVRCSYSYFAVLNQVRNE